VAGAGRGATGGAQIPNQLLYPGVQ